MKSFRGSNSSLVNTFQTLSLNSSNSNGTLGTILVNEQHKYLIMRFFDNERTVTITTSGATTATLTATIPTLATSATLTSTWPNNTCQQLVVLSSGQQRNVNFTNSSTKISWQSPLTASTSTTAISTTGQQAYSLPANVSKVKNGTITIGQLVYSPAPVQSIQEWTQLNALPYTSDVPAYFFIYNRQIYFWPIPSSTGNVITINCKINVADMTYSDYTTGNIAANGMVPNTYAITGSGTSWTSQYPTGVDLTYANLFFTANPPQGDGLPYQIQSFTDDTHLTLLAPVVNAPNITGTTTYTIGQYPILSPDFHDAIVYGALRVYYLSVVKDPERYQLYNSLYNEKLELMKLYLANKQINVDLSVTPIQQNPNLFLFGS